MTEYKLAECPICSTGFYASEKSTATDRVDQHVALDHPDWVKKSPTCWVKSGSDGKKEAQLKVD